MIHKRAKQLSVLQYRIIRMNFFFKKRKNRFELCVFSVECFLLLSLLLVVIIAAAKLIKTNFSPPKLWATFLIMFIAKSFSPFWEGRGVKLICCSRCALSGKKVFDWRGRRGKNIIERDVYFILIRDYCETATDTQKRHVTELVDVELNSSFSESMSTTASSM